ncbi:MAG: 4Fe-4S dicluster domain-containing protein [Anaerolineales bacterium]|jgi:heterodisulfide reductase subunit C|nr:4Fe-4S dicluster domain-containing protein [Anaerolineales bacterium]
MTKPSFREEVANLLYAAKGSALNTCIQCGTCSGTCPAVEYMDHTPRRMIGMILADMKDEVLASNTFWYCASCFHCTVRCPSEIDIAETMYALKRYSIWKHIHQEGLLGPTFSETFVKTIMRSGRSYEPVLATSYLFSSGVKELIQEASMATGLMLKGRLPILPPKIKRLENFKRMVSKVIPLGGLS